MSGIQIFVCGGRNDGPRCECGQLATTSCGYALRGPKAGTCCARPLCARCAVTPETPLCAPHARLANKTTQTEK